MTNSRPSDRDRFEEYLERLTATARSTDDVVGLVGFGSTADRTRVDEWSDHDFAWITVPGREDHYRHNLRWLPDAQHIALSVVEGHGGVKVIYEDGHVLEFGIASLESFARWSGNRAEVLVDRGGVADVVAGMLTRTAVEARFDEAQTIRLILTQILIGVGRARRGERLSAGQLIRGEATDHLLRALAHRLSGADVRLDSLDPRRRFEIVHPELAAQLEVAAREDVETCARLLLNLAEHTLSDGSHDFPHAGVLAIRQRLGWGSPANERRD